MLTIFLCVYIKVGGHPGGLSEWNVKWVTLALQPSLHYIQQSYCLLLQRHIAHLLFMPPACIHPQPICLSILSIVISLQPGLCCITATVIHQRPPSCLRHGFVCKGSIFYFNAALGNVTPRQRPMLASGNCTRTPKSFKVTLGRRAARSCFPGREETISHRWVRLPPEGAPPRCCYEKFQFVILCSVHTWHRN